MRIWLRPDKLAKLGLTPADVISSIKEQNLQAPAGRIGAAPSPKDQQFTYTVSAPGRLVTAEEFENIIIRGTEDAAQVRIRDVGRAELGSQDYNSFGRLDGKPAGLDGRVPAARRQPAPGGRGDLRDHGAGQGALPAGHGLQDRLRHDAGGARRRSTRS